MQRAIAGIVARDERPLSAHLPGAPHGSPEASFAARDFGWAGAHAQLTGPLNERVDVYVTHVKPGELDAVMAEIAAIETPHRIRPLAAGQRLELPRSMRGDPPVC